MKHLFLKSLLIGSLAALTVNFAAAHPISLQTPTKPPIPSITLEGHSSTVTQLVWSPDGNLLASSAGWFDSTDNTVRLWEADGHEAAMLSGHTQPVSALAWSPDSKILATGSQDQTVKLWQADGELLQTIDVQKGIVFALAWSPDGKTLASGSEVPPTQNTVQLWDTNGKLLQTMTTQFSGGKFYNLAWSPDGQFLVGGATDYAQWKADGTLVFSHESCEHCPPAWGFAWSPDSQYWVVGNESGLVWVYGVDGQQVAQLQSSGVDMMHWSPDSKWLAGGKNLWQFDGGKFTLKNYVKGEWAFAWSADSRYLASADNNHLYLQQPDGKLITSLEGHSGQAGILAWSPKANLLASGSEDGTIRLWDIDSFEN